MNRHSTLSLRFIAASIITLVVLVQAALLTHEIEHISNSDNEHCISCWVADHTYGNVNDTPKLNLTRLNDFYISSDATYLLLTNRFQHYTSRAPPASNFC